MDNKAIIQSMVDDDQYKITMANCVFLNYPEVSAKYMFKCRTKCNLGFLKEEVQAQVNMMPDLRIECDEVTFLRSFGWLDDRYIDYLKDYRYDASEVTVSIDFDGQLSIIIHGSWLRTILWEVKLLAIVNELYFRYQIEDDEEFTKGGSRCLEDSFCDGHLILTDAISLLKEHPMLKVAEFGTRRRLSRDWQKKVLGRLLNEARTNIVGTSNVRLAMDFGVKPIGTMAHEFLSAHLALCRRLELAQRTALYTWLSTYKDKLGIALSDTFGSKAFFNDFDIVLARAFDGVRHDSGDPIRFGQNMIAFYQKFGIDPRTKTIVFSDSLTVNDAVGIWKQFAGAIGVSFGIGTSLTNNVGLDPLNIVIKMIECDGKPVCKLSDNVDKAIGGTSDIIRQTMEAYRAYGVELV